MKSGLIRADRRRGPPGPAGAGLHSAGPRLQSPPDARPGRMAEPSDRRRGRPVAPARGRYCALVHAKPHPAVGEVQWSAQPAAQDGPARRSRTARRDDPASVTAPPSALKVVSRWPWMRSYSSGAAPDTVPATTTPSTDELTRRKRTPGSAAYGGRERPTSSSPSHANHRNVVTHCRLAARAIGTAGRQRRIVAQVDAGDLRAGSARRSAPVACGSGSRSIAGGGGGAAGWRASPQRHVDARQQASQPPASADASSRRRRSRMSSPGQLHAAAGQQRAPERRL